MAKYLSIGDAAAFTGLSEQQVRKYFDLGAFEGFLSPGGHRQVSLESAENFNRSPKEIMQRVRWKRMQEQGKMIGTCKVTRRI